MWKEFQAMNPNNDAPPAEIPAEKAPKKSSKKTSAKKGDLKIRIKVPKPKKTKKNSSASEDDFEDDLDFNMEPEPSKAKRVSSRANKGAREEDEDFETMPSFQKVLQSFTLIRVQFVVSAFGLLIKKVLVALHYDASNDTEAYVIQCYL